MLEASLPHFVPKQLFVGLSLIGQGSFAKVYKTSLADQDAVIKEVVCSQSLSTGLLTVQMEHLSREIAALSDAHHPNVVSLLGATVDFCTSPPSFGLVLELCPLGSIHHVLFETRTALPTNSKVRLCSEVAAGLAHLHGHNILHRDLNTANVLLSRDLTPKIADFGCSVRASARLLIAPPSPKHS